MYKQKFFFIVFEGIEGTGKSYQISKLFSFLKKKNIKTLKTREPGGSVSAEKIRNLIFNKKSNYLDKLTDFYLMLAARNEHLIKTLLPAQKKKIVVISDRFSDSTYAYQVVGKKINFNLFKINNDYILKNFKPNLVIILKSNFGSINERIKKRKKNNKFDKLKKSFYLKAQNSFIKIAKKNKSNYELFDSSLNNSDLEKKILKLVLKKIKYDE
jgi:dTMP kinase